LENSFPRVTQIGQGLENSFLRGAQVGEGLENSFPRGGYLPLGSENYILENPQPPHALEKRFLKAGHRAPACWSDR
jgi:hypothetical protein